MADRGAVAAVAAERSPTERLILQALLAHGIQASRLALFSTPGAELPPGCRIVDAAARLTLDADLGLELAAKTPLRSGSPLVYLMLASPTLGSSLDLLIRHLPDVLVAEGERERPALLERRGDAILVDVGPAHAAYAEYVVALLVRVARFIVDDPALVPEAVHFAHEATPHRRDRALLRQLGAAVSFGRSHGALHLGRAQLALPSVGASPLLLQAYERSLAAGLFFDSREAFLRRLERALERGLDSGATTLAEAARAVALDVDQLQRRLDEQHLELAAVVADVRRRRALSLLAGDSLSVEAVAQALGYRNVRSLQRVFRTWTGLSPGAYRRLAQENRARKQPS